MKHYLLILTKMKDKAALAREMAKDTFRFPVIFFSKSHLKNVAN